ncbi:hypothetical protein ACQKML_00745 [Peribacillus frigoritolerans]
MSEKRFRLNIETQSVVGIILEIEQESYHLIDNLSQEQHGPKFKSPPATCPKPSRNV